MKRFFRALFFAIGLAFVMIATNNCSGHGTGFGSIAGFCSNNCATATASSASVYLPTQGFSIIKGQSYLGNCNTLGIGTMACGVPATLGGTAAAIPIYYFPQQIQVSGMCSTAGAAVNQISFQVNHIPSGSINGVPYLTDINGVPYANYSTTCDNGRFTIMLTPPPYNAADPKVYPLAATNLQLLTLNFNSVSDPLQLMVTIKTGSSMLNLAVAASFATNFYVSY